MVYIIVVVLGWMRQPAFIEVSAGSHSQGPSMILLECRAPCGCAYEYAFEEGECADEAAGTMAAGEQHYLRLCFSERWDEGLFVSGAYNVARIGRASVLFASDASRAAPPADGKERVLQNDAMIASFDPPSRVSADQTDNVPLTPLPGTDAITQNGRLNRRAKAVVMRQIDRVDTTVQPSTRTHVYAIGHSTESVTCAVAAPQCADVTPVRPNNDDDLRTLARSSGYEDEPTTSANDTKKRQLLPGNRPPLRDSLGGSLEGGDTATLQSCYLLQKDPVLIEFIERSSFQVI